MGPSGMGISLVLIAAGAIMRWAVTVNNSHGFNINTAGLILLIVGIVGLIASVAYMTTRRRTNVIHEGPMGASRTTYSEPPPPPY